MAQHFCDNVLWSVIGVIIINFLIFCFGLRDLSYERVSFFILFQEVGIKDLKITGEADRYRWWRCSIGVEIG